MFLYCLSFLLTVGPFIFSLSFSQTHISFPFSLSLSPFVIFFAFLDENERVRTRTIDKRSHVCKLSVHGTKHERISFVCNPTDIGH
jgi:hypothetical protein